MTGCTCAGVFLWFPTQMLIVNLFRGKKMFSHLDLYILVIVHIIKAQFHIFHHFLHFDADLLTDHVSVLKSGSLKVDASKTEKLKLN